MTTIDEQLAAIGYVRLKDISIYRVVLQPKVENFEQRRDSAKLYASQVRSRKPEMQVKRLEK